MIPARMRFRILPAMTVAGALIACAAKPPFWSVLGHKFEEVRERPYRAELIGRWRSERESMALLPNGKFTASRHSGCWDVDKITSGGPYVIFVMGCMDYGGEVVVMHLTIMARRDEKCAFTLGHRLALRDCEFAGEYRKE